jgi:hypothetical protein
MHRTRVRVVEAPLVPGAGGDWQSALEALKATPLPKGKVAVVLSNHFVRYALVPWNSALSGVAEEAAYVRHQFTRIYGERAKAWSFRASPASGDAPRLCSAIDTLLLEELKKLFSKGKARLVSVQPQLMATFIRWRGAVRGAGAVIVMV